MRPSRMVRKTRLTRERAASTVRQEDQEVPAVAERLSEADARIWLNALEIAQGLRKPPSTVYSALGGFLRYSRRVGRERRYPWVVAFELCRAYAIPVDEFSEAARSFLEMRARDRDADPRDLFSLYYLVLRRWLDVGLEEVPVTPEMIRRLHLPPRPRDPEVIRAARAIQESEETPQRMVVGPRRIPASAWEQAASESP